MGGFVSAVFNDAVDVVTDIGETIGDAGSFIYKEAVHPVVDIGVDLTMDFVDLNLDAIDFVADDIFGVSGTMTMLQNASTGVRFLSHEALDGNWKAALMLGAAVVSLWLAIPSGGMSLIGFINLASTLYGITMSMSEVGRMVTMMGQDGFIKYLQEIRDMMALAFTNAWINGSMNMWMAGGALYDSPKAGDVLFNTTGSLKTTKFLNLQEENNTTWSNWSLGRYAEFQQKTFGNLAGDTFFSVSPLAQRI